MDLENKPFYSLLPWFISVLVSALFVLLLRKELAHQENHWQEHLRLQQVAAESALKVSQQHVLQQAAGYALLVSQDPQVAAMVQRAAAVYAQEQGNSSSEPSLAVRNQLKQTLEHSWAQLVPLGLRELNIHLAPEGIVFLRLNSERYGDNMSQTSPLAGNGLKKRCAGQCNGAGPLRPELSRHGASVQARFGQRVSGGGRGGFGSAGSPGSPARIWTSRADQFRRDQRVPVGQRAAKYHGEFKKSPEPLVCGNVQQSLSQELAG